jgi:hypothetical protein
LAVRRLDRQLTKSPKSCLAKKLDKRKRHLQTKIDGFLNGTPSSVASLAHKDQPHCSREQLDRDSDALGDEDDDNDDMDGDDEDTSEDEDDLEDHPGEPVKSSPGRHDAPEHIMLPLPSRLGLTRQEMESIAPTVEDEVTIRQSQAAEALEQLRLSLGIKSAIFRKQRGAERSYQKKTRALKAANTATAAVKQHARCYSLAHSALVQLGADKAILTRFPLLEKEDLRISRDVVEENRVGQRSEHVSWIWRLDIGKSLGENAWLEESE